ncbi:hypothetical protein GCM10009589_38570 [Arthrobacter pascens]
MRFTAAAAASWSRCCGPHPRGAAPFPAAVFGGVAGSGGAVVDRCCLVLGVGLGVAAELDVSGAAGGGGVQDADASSTARAAAAMACLLLRRLLAGLAEAVL